MENVDPCKKALWGGGVSQCKELAGGGADMLAGGSHGVSCALSTMVASADAIWMMTNTGRNPWLEMVCPSSLVLAPA